MTFIYDLLYITFGITTITTIRPQQSDTPLGYGPWNIGREWIIFLRKTAARMGEKICLPEQIFSMAEQPNHQIRVRFHAVPPFGLLFSVRKLPQADYSVARIPGVYRP